MKILITGANGNIGSHLCDRLRKNNYITAIDYGFNKNNNNFINLDLTNLKNVNDFDMKSNSYDVLIFLVGLAHSKGKRKEFSDFKELNYQTLVNFLSKLKKENNIPLKIIFSSTISVYGELMDQTEYFEKYDCSPNSPYAVTKLEAENYLLSEFSDNIWLLRFAPVYSSDFLLNINRRIRMGRKFYRVGKGHERLSLCNIENIEVVIQAIIRDKVPPGVYNISDPIDYSYNDILKNQNASQVLPIPRFIVQIAYTYGKMTNNYSLMENAVKLLTDNVYPSTKIRSHVEFYSTINNIK